MGLLKSHMTIIAYIPKGTITLTEAVDIGSVTLVGGGDFIKPSALATLENDIDKLHCVDLMDQRLTTSPTLVGSGAATLNGGAECGTDKDGSGSFLRLRNYLHAICRFLGHGF